MRQQPARHFDKIFIIVHPYDIPHSGTHLVEVDAEAEKTEVGVLVDGEHGKEPADHVLELLGDQLNLDRHLGHHLVVESRLPAVAPLVSFGVGHPPLPRQRLLVRHALVLLPPRELVGGLKT